MSDSQAQPIRIKAVVVNFNAGAYLRQCIDALTSSDLPVEICIVDNASSDASLSDLPATVEVITNQENGGFPKACNQGAAGSTLEFLLFINPDCFVERDTLTKLVKALDDEPGFALLGARILGADGKDQRASRRRSPTVLRTFFTVTGLERWERRLPYLQGINMGSEPPMVQVETVGAVSGALMLVRRTDFEGIGGFDEDYFLHCEDLDLCRRLVESSRLVGLVRGAKATHVKGVTQRRSPWRSEWLKHRNMLRFVAKFKLAGAFGTALLAAAIGFRFVLLSPMLAWRQLRSSFHE